MYRSAAGEHGERGEYQDGECTIDAEINRTIVLRKPQTIVEISTELVQCAVCAAIRRVWIAEGEIEKMRGPAVAIDELAAAEEWRLVAHAGHRAKHEQAESLDRSPASCNGW